MEPSVLMELQYLPPIQYFTKFIAHQQLVLEQWEHYRKGSYRNRCHIAGANGWLRLSIPLKKGKNEKQAIQEVEISYDTPWQSHHWHSIRSAYGNAPYFDYYADTLYPFFQEKTPLLFDFNYRLLSSLGQMLGGDFQADFTTQFVKETSVSVLDWRNNIHPKPKYHQADPHFQQQKYAQVFEEKTGFLPNLSILDLLFCTGPQASLILEQCIVNQ